MSDEYNIPVMVAVATKKVNQAAEMLKERAAAWEPRPCPKNWTGR